MTDEFSFMDQLQDDADEAIEQLLPFEPDREVRQDTEHEEPVEAEPEFFEPDDEAAADPDQFDIMDIEHNFETDIVEGFDDL